MTAIWAVRALHAVYAVLVGITAAFQIRFAIGGGDSVGGDEGGSRVVSAIGWTAAFAVAAAGAFFMRRKPMRWSVAIAVVATVVTALVVASSGASRASAVNGGLALLLWGAVVVVRKAHETLAARPG